jgi:cytochrome c oxidase subunit 3
MMVEVKIPQANFLQIQYQSLEQQENTATLGMWVFIATEILFFGGLFLAYTVYRITYPDTFSRAGKELNIMIGTVNTFVLLLSSYFMALSVRAVKLSRIKMGALFLGCTWMLGFTFLILKAYEYYDDFQKHLVPTSDIIYSGQNVHAAKLFYFIYYAMTGLHAVHMTVGLGVIAVMYLKVIRNKYSSSYCAPLEVSGLYWHFVDVIWIFLYPLLYLMDRHS